MAGPVAAGGCCVPAAPIAPPFVVEAAVPPLVVEAAVPAGFAPCPDALVAFLLLGWAAPVAGGFAPDGCLVAGEPFAAGAGVGDGALPAVCCPPDAALPPPLDCAAATIAVAAASARI